MNLERDIKLLLVDDHPVVREGLRRIEELEPRIQIVAEADTKAAAVDLARQFNPELILMDVRLPDGDGIGACREIKEFLPEVHVLFLTSYADNKFVLAAMEAGADGYLLKESGTQRILAAVHSILNGGTVFDPVVARQAINPAHGGRTNPLKSLTILENRVLEEVASGKTDKEVAMALGITPKTARNYVTRIFAKLNVHNRTEAALIHARGGEPVPS